MQPKSEQQQLAKELYLNTDKTQQEIADILNVHRRTIYLWMKNGKWEELKIAIRQAPAVIINDIYNHFDAINQRIYNRPPDERCPTMEEVNMMYKLLKMSNTISRQHTGAYMEAYTELLKFINKKDHVLAKKVTNLADQYVMGNVLNSNTAFDDMMKVRMDLVMNNLENYEKTQLPDTPEAPGQTPAQETSTPVSDSTIEPLNSDSSIEPLSHSAIEPLSEPLPTKCGNDVIMCANDVTMSCPSSICPKPAIVKHHEGNGNISLSQNDTEKIFPENVTMPPDPSPLSVTIPSEPQPEINPNSEFPIPNSNQPIPNSTYYASLPSSQRPSPFREGNIIWVNNINDVNDDELKMGDSIRHYPDMDPTNKMNLAMQKIRPDNEVRFTD